MLQLPWFQAHANIENPNGEERKVESFWRRNGRRSRTGRGDRDTTTWVGC